MFKRYIVSSALAVLCAAVGVSAGSAGTTAGQQEPQKPAMDQAASATVEGCVYREQDIPGRAPNVAERAGVLEDYILVVADQSAASPGAVGTSGTAATANPTAKLKMFKLEHAADDQLSAMVGKRVRVLGKVDAEAGDRATAGASGTDKSLGPDRIELPEFEVKTIEAISGSCPASPAVRK